MAGSPRFKVYDAAGNYVGCVKHPSDAAMLVASYGEGATIRDGHRTVVWLEGADGLAAESYDAVAETVFARTGGQAS